MKKSLSKDEVRSALTDYIARHAEDGRLPPLRTLSRKLGVSIYLIRKHLGAMQREGILRTRNRVGLFLTPEGRRREVDALLVKNCDGPGPAETAMKKYLTPEQTMERRQMIASHWDEIRKELKQQIIPSDELRSMLKKAHCPVTPEEIGLTREQYLHAVPTAQLIRIRYTVLDLLYECGLLDDACRTLLP